MLLALESISVDSSEFAMNRLMATEGVTSDVVSLLQSIIPKSVSIFKELIPNLGALDTARMKPVTFDRRQLAVMRATAEFDFSVYEDTLLMVPEGLAGNLIGYVDALCGQGKLITANGMKVLNEYTTELSMFLSNADLRTSLKSAEAHYRQVKEERLSHEAVIKTFFDPKFPTRSRLPLSRVVDRFGDLDALYKRAATLQNYRKQIDYHAIQTVTKKASDLLDLVKHRLDTGDIKDISGQIAKNLSIGAFEVGKYVETIAVFGYYTEAALASVDNITEKLAELFKIR